MSKASCANGRLRRFLAQRSGKGLFDCSVRYDTAAFLCFRQPLQKRFRELAIALRERPFGGIFGDGEFPQPIDDIRGVFRLQPGLNSFQQVPVTNVFPVAHREFEFCTDGRHQLRANQRFESAWRILSLCRHVLSPCILNELLGAPVEPFIL